MLHSLTAGASSGNPFALWHGGEMQARAVTEAALGAWLFKSSVRDWDAGTRIETRCVADNYRKDVMRRGQRALLWVSGSATGSTPRGIWGFGWITDDARFDPHEDSWIALTDVTLLPVDDRVHATDLREIPGLSAVEVLRLPQGSNPSWVTTDQLALIEPLLPDWPAL